MDSTPSQTVGPFLHIGLPWPDGAHVVEGDTPDAIWIKGTVYDGAGEVVPDALVETWQADPDGHFDHPDSPQACEFRGFGRCPTDDAGQYAIRTLIPGAVDGQAPHIDVSVFARGMLSRVITRLYFPDLVDGDPLLDTVPEDRRHTLIAAKAEDGYRFDIRLQGAEETVFFDL
jgi:protocatechuate 3,4-dioxygenase alpha subunit